MANFFKEFTKKSVERFKTTKEDESLLKSRTKVRRTTPRRYQSLKRTRNEPRRFAMSA